MEFNNSLESRKRVLARVINGWKATKQDKKIRDEAHKTLKFIKLEVGIIMQPSPEDLKNAEQLTLVIGMISTAIAYEEGKLTSLMPVRSGKMFVTSGRLGEKSIEAILGVSALPILMNNCRVAEMFMWRAYTG